MTYTDIIGKAADQATVVAAVAAMRAAEFSLCGMLGNPLLDEGGNEIARTRQGMPATSYTDPDSGETVQVAATGDGASWYFGGRIAGSVSVDVAAYGLTACPAAEAAQVLGVWA